jgi:O-antigen ligase
LALRNASNRPSRGALVLSAALLPLFLHADFQPSLDAGSVTIRLADLAVLAVAAAAVAEGGRERLRAGRWIWVATLAFFAVVAVSMLAAAASDRAYPFGDHAVTALKYAEYALLAVAVPLVVRRRADVDVVLRTMVALGVVATVVAALQFVGVDILHAWPAGRRQPSFLGHHDFAALSGAVLAIAYVRRWRLAAVGGTVGLVLSGAITGAAGLLLAAVVALLAAHRRRLLTRQLAVTVAVTVAAVLVGVVAIRSANIAELLDDDTTGNVETFSHRGVLAYVGVKEFAGHPLLGIGWQASLDEAGYGPYLDDARRRYPAQPARVFPSPEEPWGVQNAYLQALADLGALGGLAVLGLAAAAIATARRGWASGEVALTGTLWLCIVAGVWNGIGFIAGLPLDALLWLGLGFVAAGAAGVADE